MAAADWSTVQALLHPYLHWTESALLADDPGMSFGGGLKPPFARPR